MLVNLSNNENVLGASPKARAAVERQLDQVHRYPAIQDDALIEALASLHGVGPQQVVTGNGAQHVLRVIATTYLAAGSVAAGLDPTYTGYRAATAAVRATYLDIPALDGGYDLRAWLEMAPRAHHLWLCSPNNPTGCTLRHRDAVEILRWLPSTTTVVLDATYSDFVNDPEAVDAFRLLRDDPRVMVVKSFSKLYGLAGLRVGYVVADEDRIAAIRDRIDTFPVNRLGQAAALAALADRDHQEATRRLVIGGRVQLMEGLRSLGLEVFESQANFVTIRVDEARERIVETVREAGFLIRPLEGWRLPQHLRITVGRPEHNDAVLSAIGRALDRGSV